MACCMFPGPTMLLAPGSERYGLSGHHVLPESRRASYYMQEEKR
jgi:hypothetical protein